MAALDEPKQKWMVLVVEDDEDLLKMLTRTLEQAGYEVMTASDGQSGLAMACGRPTPNLIISDVMMPDMDGIEMVRQIKQDPDSEPTPVIFLTAKDTPKDIVSGIRAGARHYLTKPFPLPELLEKIRSILPGVRG